MFSRLFAFTQIFALIVLTGFFSGEAAAADNPTQEWRGEELGKRQGAFYLKMRLKGFKSAGTSVPGAQTVQFHFYSIIQKKKFVLSHLVGESKGPATSLWKIRSGKYRITKISMVDDTGTTRTWRAKKKKRKSFIIKRKALSNLGMISLKPKKSNGLKVSFKMISDSYDRSRAEADSLLTSVIHGFNGQVQTKVAGKKAFASKRKSIEARSKLRAEYTFKRKIVMYFRLDLYKHNRYAKSIIKTLAQSDSRFRACYTDVLEGDERLKGSLKFRFLLSKSIGAMKKLKFGGGSINKPKMTECLFNELNGLRFPVPETMIGELQFTFDVKY